MNDLTPILVPLIVIGSIFVGLAWLYERPHRKVERVIGIAVPVVIAVVAVVAALVVPQGGAG